MARELFGLEVLTPDPIADDPSKKTWLGEEPEFPEEDIAETVETDVIVCGAGVAGVSAVRAAAENGAKVILFEKSRSPQGRGGQFAIIGGKFLERWGMSDKSLGNEIVNFLMRDSSYRANQRILKRFADTIGDAFDWYLEGAPEDLFYQHLPTDPAPDDRKNIISLMRYPLTPNYNRYNERYPCYALTNMIRPDHKPILLGNYDLAVKTGNVSAYFSTPVKKLLRGSDGSIIGVIARTGDGKVIKALARKGVVLATGDYSGNRDMLEYYCPWAMGNRAVPCGVDDNRKPLNTGDGHRMGLWAGAKMEEGPHGAMTHCMGGAMGSAPYLLLNVHGERFMNEDCPGQQLENQLNRVKGNTAWQFFDSRWAEQIPYMPYGHGSPTEVVDSQLIKDGKIFEMLSPNDGYAAQVWLDSAVERGRAFRANTLEELFDKIGLPKDRAAESVARYNYLVKKGSDDDFGKSGERLFLIENPPYYASEYDRALLLAVVSGLESDHEARVLNYDREPIPGLYAAGNVQGSRFGADYHGTLPGISHSMALVYGRIAGQNAAMK